MTRAELFIPGTPAPQGSKRHVGNGVMIESSKAVAPWRQAVSWILLNARLTPIPGPVAVSLTFHLARPKSAPKRRTVPDVKPDIDKLVRSTLDAIVESGLIEDDARVVILHASKWYAEAGTPTGVWLTVKGAA